MITAMPRVAIVVRDFDEAIANFQDRLGMGVRELTESKESLGVRIAFCAPGEFSHIELMGPHEPGRPLNDTLTRTLDRRGEGFYAMMLNADDPDSEAEELGSRGLPAMPLMPEAEGRDFHPKNMGGVLVRIYPTAQNPMFEKMLTETLGPPEARKPDTGLSGISTVQIAVPDIDAAISIYKDQVGLDTRVKETADGTRVATCIPPRGGEIELCAPNGADSEIAQFLNSGSRGLFAIVHETDDPEKAADLLKARDVSTTRVANGCWEIDMGVTHGARIRFRASR